MYQSNDHTFDGGRTILVLVAILVLVVHLICWDYQNTSPLNDRTPDECRTIAVP